ncbi:MAG: PQQ-binding-like beta-propeller repeat protein [Gemmataceae bacterium]
MGSSLRVLAVAWLGASVVLASDWPTWRGPDGQGHASEKNPPLHWGPKENIAWKIPLPDEGNSTPILIGKRIFLTQATEKGKRRALWCLDRATGKQLWTREVTFTDKEPTHATNPYCSASPVSDGEVVVVSHGSAGVFAYDLSGKELWKKDVGKLHHIWGNASSPVLHGDLAIFWCGPGDRQFLLAVNRKTGAKVWQHDEPGGDLGKKRPWIGSWSTPLVVKASNREELLLGVPGKFKAFDPATGKELWHCSGLANQGKDELVYTSPVYADGIAVALAGFSGGGVAVRTGGSGDISATHRVWEQPAPNPQRIGSPVIVGPHLFLVNEPGSAQCWDLKTGKEVWRKDRLLDSTWGSLVEAGGKLFATSRTGTTVVFEAGPRFVQVARNAIGEPVYASPVICDGQLFLRSYRHLWCFGSNK